MICLVSRFCGCRLVLAATPKRFVHTSYVNHTNEKKFDFQDSETRAEIRLRAGDGVSRDYRLVYRAPMENYILMNQAFSTGSLWTFAGIYAFKYVQALSLGLSFFEVARIQDTTNFELIAFTGGISFFVLTTLWLSVSYPLRIYRKEDTDKFAYIKFGLLPFQKRKFDVDGGNVKPVDIERLPLGVYNKDVQNKKALIILPQYFKSPLELKKLTGVEIKYSDKPPQ